MTHGMHSTVLRLGLVLVTTVLLMPAPRSAAQDDDVPAPDESPVEAPLSESEPAEEVPAQADVEVAEPPPVVEPPPVEEPPPAATSESPAFEDDPPPPPPKKEKPKAVAIGSFLQAGMGPAWNVSSPEFGRYRDELFEGEEATGRVTWGRFAWSIDDTPAYFQAGVMRTGGALSEGYESSSGSETFKVSMNAVSVDLGVGAQWTAPQVNPFSFYGDAALVIISADTVAESGAGSQRNEDTNVAMLLRGGVRIAIYGPLAADAVLHLGGMMDRAVTGGLSYVF